MHKTSMFLVILIIVSAAVICGCTAGREIQVNPMVAPQRVLVAAFSDASSYSYGRTRYDASVFLEQALSRTGQVTVIPRQEWQAKIDTITRDDAIGIGKTMGADVVIIGKIVDFHVDHEYNPDAPLLSQRHEYNVVTHVRADVIEVANAQLLSTEKATGTAEKRTTRFFRAGPISVDAVRERPLLNEALRDAARQLAYDIVHQLHASAKP